MSGKQFGPLLGLLAANQVEHRGERIATDDLRNGLGTFPLEVDGFFKAVDERAVLTDQAFEKGLDVLRVLTLSPA